MNDCPFCEPDPSRTILERPLVVALWDAFPVSAGHALVVTRRHVASWFEATDDEQRALLAAIEPVRARIERAHRPDGYNLGLNVGTAAGQTVMHVHLHVIPRYGGDVPDPRGGIRLAIPAKGNYLATPSDAGLPAGAPAVREQASTTGPMAAPSVTSWVASAGSSSRLEAGSSWDAASGEPGSRGDRSGPDVGLSGPTESGDPVSRGDLAGLDGLPHARGLVAGEGDRLVDHLRVHLAGALHVDIAVAFVQRSGLDELEAHLVDLLARPGARLRVVTGDYLDVSDPDALALLLDLGRDLPHGPLEARVFETTGGPSFHPKAYVFHPLEHAPGAAFVGSSNLSRLALRDGVEWNVRVIPSVSGSAFVDVARAFEELFAHPRTVPLDEAWIDRYRARRRPTFAPARNAPAAEPLLSDEAAAPPEPLPEPRQLQREALDALEATRAQGCGAGLVVLATGLGKTWLAAFDASRTPFRRVLFLAHREEILRQALGTFRRVRPAAHLGLYTGGEKDAGAEVLFASVQTLSRPSHLARFARDHFDYVVVDEFHHADAASYRRVLDHFEPRFLLGLTATPERTDGGNLLALCQQNLVYRCDLTEGIERNELAPFHYFGVPDEVDYAHIPWRSGRFDEDALTRAVATEARAANALAQWRKHAGPGSRTIAFTVSVRHADFMAAYFRDQGLRAVAVHSQPSSAPRTLSLERLEAGELDIVCAVDLLNEGVDLPRVDCVLLLRPTESRIVFLQQLGRGLRKHDDKPHLTVVDYIGNHRSFLARPAALLGLDEGHAQVRTALEAYEARTLELPDGCEVTYELEALDLLKRMLDLGARDRLAAFYESFRDRHGTRPSALETYEAGLNPGSIRRAHGTWLGFVRDQGDLTADEAAALDATGGFLGALETTQMTRSFKMLVLRALLTEDALPGELSIERLVTAFRRAASPSPLFSRDVGAPLDDDLELRRYLEKNPIDAWTKGKGTGGHRYFAYEDGRFRATFDVPAPLRSAFQGLVRELVDWRLAAYLDRARTSITCRVSRNDRHPILFFDPPRGRQPGIPEGWVSVLADGDRYEANLVQIAINVLRRPGSTENVLPDLLTRWFGPDAGRPGTNHRVILEPAQDETFRMSPKREVTHRLALVADDRKLDAHFRLETAGSRLSLVYESRGGTAGSKSERNVDYQVGLELLLERIALAGLVVEDLLVETAKTQRLPGPERRITLPDRPYPWRLTPGDDLTGLRKQIGRAQAAIGRDPKRQRGPGNATKTIRFELSREASVAGYDDVAALLASPRVARS